MAESVIHESRFVALERRSNILDRGKTKTDMKVGEMKEELAIFGRKLGLVEGKIDLLLTKVTGSSHASTLERMDRLEKAIQTTVAGQLQDTTQAKSNVKHWMMERVTELEQLVDDLKWDFRDNLPDGLNKKHCEDLCSSTIKDFCKLENRFQTLVLDSEMEARIQTLEVCQSSVRGGPPDRALISVSLLRDKINTMEEQISAIHGDLGIALCGVWDVNAIHSMKDNVEGWREDKAMMQRAIDRLEAEAFERDQNIKLLMRQMKRMLTEQGGSPKRQKIN